MTPITDFNEKEFDAGAEAFKADDDHLLFNCTPSFLEGYKEAFLEWAVGEYPRAANNPDSNHLEEYWDAHYEDAVTGVAGRILNAIGEPKHRAVVGTQTMMLLNSIGTFLLGVATASLLTLLFLAPFLMSNEEVIAFWKEVL